MWSSRRWKSHYLLYDAALVEATARAAKARALELAQSALPPFARNPYKYLGKGRWLTYVK
jgi:hypothetical protein